METTSQRRWFDSIRSNLVIGDRKGIIRIFDLTGGQQVNHFTADQIPIGKIALSSDGNLLATWSDVYGLGLESSLMRVKIWDLRTNALIQDVPGSFGFPRALAFSPDSRKLAIEQLGTAFVLWDISKKSGTAIRSDEWKEASDSEVWVKNFGLGAITGLEPDPEGKRVVASTNHGTSLLIDSASGEIIQNLQTIYYAPARGQVAAFSPKGENLALIGASNRVDIYDSVGNDVQSLDFDSNIDGIAFSADGKGLFTIDENAQLSSTQWANQKLTTFQPRLLGSGLLGPIAVGRTNDLVACSRARDLLVWRTDLANTPLYTYHCDSEIEAATLRPDGQRLAISYYGEIIVLDAFTGTVIVRFRPYPNARYHFETVRFTKGGLGLLIGGDDCTVQLWSIENGNEARTLRPPDRKAGDGSFTPGSAFSPDSNWIDTRNFHQSRQMVDPGHSIGTLTSVKSNNWAFTDGQGTDAHGIISIWDAAAGRIETKLWGHKLFVNAMAVHPNQRFLVSGSQDRSARLWDLETGGGKGLPGHGGTVTSVAFSRSGKLIATACRDGFARVFSFPEGERQATLVAHKADATVPLAEAVCFTPDDQFLITSSWDGGVRFWRTSGWDLAFELHGHEDPWVRTRLSQSGRWLFTTSQDQYYRVWDIDKVNSELVAPPN